MKRQHFLRMYSCASLRQYELHQVQGVRKNPISALRHPPQVELKRNIIISKEEY